MPIVSNGANIKEVSYGTTPISKVYYGSSLVWQADKTGTVVFPPGLTGTGARNFFRNALSERGLDYRTVVEIPFGMDVSQVTTMSNMFYNCSSLTHVPEMDTSKVTTMSNMFYNCSSLTHVPEMDTSNVTNTSYMFQNCSSLTSVPEMDTSQVTNMSSMFQNCSSLTHVPEMDTSNVTNTGAMFYNCSSLTDGSVRLIRKDGTLPSTRTSMIAASGLTREPFFDINGNPIP